MKSFVATLVASILIAAPLLANKGQHGNGGPAGPPSNGPSVNKSGPSNVGSNTTNTIKSGPVSTQSNPQRSMSPARFGNSSPVHTDYRIAHGRQFEFGYRYEGRHHYQWTYYCWWPRFNCYTYWCPSACCYYYWCEPQNCYLPVSAATTYVPTSGAPLIEIQNNNNNVNTVGAGPTSANVSAAVGSELPAPPRP